MKRYRHQSYSFLHCLLMQIILILSPFTIYAQDQRENQNQQIDQLQKIKDLNIPALRVMLISSMIGYIEPCGCTIDLKLGGLDRIAYFIQKSREYVPTLVFVVGNYLFEDHIPESRIAQDENKAKLIHDIFHQLKINAIIPGKNDYLRGEAFFQSLYTQTPLPLMVDTPKLFKSEYLNQLSYLGVIAIPADIDEKNLQEKIAKLKNDIVTLKQNGAQTIIALSVTQRAITQQLAQEIKEINFWVLGDHPLEEKNIIQLDQSYMIEAGDRGRHIAILDLYHPELDQAVSDFKSEFTSQKTALELQIKRQNAFAGFKKTNPIELQNQLNQIDQQLKNLDIASLAKEKNLKSFDYYLYPISKDEPQQKDILSKIEHFQKSLKEINLAQAGKVIPLEKNQNGYAGTAECALCHPSAQAAWEKSRHAKAWDTLVKDDKTFDVECVSCHVTGWQKPGGTALGHTEGKEDVQCEACHGPSAKHAEVGGGESYTKKFVPKEVCTTCHNQLHSPKFNYEEYLKKIIVPGHGLPQLNGGSDTVNMPKDPSKE